MLNKFSLHNKVALVTGASGLLGQAHCEALAEAGASVVVTDLSLMDCESVVSKLDGRHMAVGLDVTDKSNLQAVCELIIGHYGRLDILVNNAAVNDMVEDPKTSADLSGFEDYPLEYWNRSLEVNLTGVFLCSQIFGGWMAANRGGSIINIGSTYGITAPDQSLYQDEYGNQVFRKPPAYSVTKGGVIMFTRYLAAYWGKKNVRVNTLSPGGVQNGQNDFFVEKYSSRTPLNRMAGKNDYQGALIFLASDASAYMTGGNLVVDGGWTAW